MPGFGAGVEVGISVLAHQRACLRDAALHELCLNLEFLVRPQVDSGLEGQVPGQRNADAMLSWRKEHRFSMSIKLIRMSRELFVDENGSPLRRRRDFQLSRPLLRRLSRFFREG